MIRLASRIPEVLRSLPWMRNRPSALSTETTDKLEEVMPMRAAEFPNSVPPRAPRHPCPDPSEGEVRVHAAWVNGFDLAAAGGNLKGMMAHRFPVILGKGFAGVINSVGSGVTSYTAGGTEQAIVESGLTNTILCKQGLRPDPQQAAQTGMVFASVGDG